MPTSLTGVLKFFPKAQNGFATTLASSVLAGATTLPLNSLAGYTTGDVAVLVVEPTSSTNKQAVVGTVDTVGVQLTGCVWTTSVGGSNVPHAGGVAVVDYTTATHIDMISTGILVEHLQSGLHNYAAIAAGLPAASITPGKLATGAAAGNVATAETTVSAIYGQLATTTDQCTVVIGANGLALVSFSAQTFCVGGSGDQSIMTYSATGANTIAALDANAIVAGAVAPSSNTPLSRTVLLTGLTPGSTVWKLQYRTTGGGTASFSQRNISVVPL